MSDNSKQLIAKLKRWSKHNSLPWLAWRMGYASSVTIEQWIRREQVPTWVQNRLSIILEEKEEENNFKKAL